jgi:hypothetical protein
VATSKPRKYSRLKNPVVERKDESGKTYARRPNGDRHYAPEGADTEGVKVWRSSHNYETSDERSSRMTANKATRAKLISDRDKKPDFTVSHTNTSSAKVNWNKSGKAEAPKQSVAKQHAIEMTSQGVKDAVHSANSAPKPVPKSHVGSSDDVKNAIANSGRAPEPSSSTTHPAANKAQFTSATRPQPEAKSFDTHANEALSVAKSGKGKSFNEHANEAVSMGNSGKSSRRPSPKPVAGTPKKSASPVQDSDFQAAKQKAASRSSTPEPSSRHVESENVDAVSGLAPSRAKRKAVKAARNLDEAQKSYSKNNAGRKALKTNLNEQRKASKPQGPLDRLINGERPKPAKKLGAVEHVARKAALGIGDKLESRKVGKVAGKYEKAKSKAYDAHDDIQSGRRRPSNSDIGAVAGAAGRVAVKGAKLAGKIVAENVKGDINAARLAHHEVKSGRAPEPKGSSNRNVSTRQFGASTSVKGRQREWPAEDN